MFVCLFVCLFVGTANASVIVSDSVNDNQWGLIQFDWTGGLIDINGLGNGYTTGETGVGAGDIYFSLLEDDGSSFNSFTGTHLTSNDDSGVTGWNDDGSTSGLDSFINDFNLSSGSFLLTISHCCQDFDLVRNINSNSGLGQSTNDYQVTFSNGATITALNGEAVNAVPEPGSLALLAIGLAGVGFSRKKKSA